MECHWLKLNKYKMEVKLMDGVEEICSSDFWVCEQGVYPTPEKVVNLDFKINFLMILSTQISSVYSSFLPLKF